MKWTDAEAEAHAAGPFVAARDALMGPLGPPEGGDDAMWMERAAALAAGFAADAAAQIGQDGAGPAGTDPKALRALAVAARAALGWAATETARSGLQRAATETAAFAATAAQETGLDR